MRGEYTVTKQKLSGLGSTLNLMVSRRKRPLGKAARQAVQPDKDSEPQAQGRDL